MKLSISHVYLTYIVYQFTTVNIHGHLEIKVNDMEILIFKNQNIVIITIIAVPMYVYSHLKVVYKSISLSVFIVNTAKLVMTSTDYHLLLTIIVYSKTTQY